MHATMLWPASDAGLTQHRLANTRHLHVPGSHREEKTQGALRRGHGSAKIVPLHLVILAYALSPWTTTVTIINNGRVITLHTSQTFRSSSRPFPHSLYHCIWTSTSRLLAAPSPPSTVHASGAAVFPVCWHQHAPESARRHSAGHPATEGEGDAQGLRPGLWSQAPHLRRHPLEHSTCNNMRVVSMTILGAFHVASVRMSDPAITNVPSSFVLWNESIN